MEEHKLIKSAQDGDASAFEQIIGLYYDVMYRFAYKWCGNRDNAQDITQNACIKLARSIDQYKFQSAFSSWLYRLVINCAKDWYKSNKNVNNKEDNIDDHYYLEAKNNRNDENLYLLQVLRMMDDFPDGIKETMLLVHAHGFNHSEAADILEIKESTVSWRIHEARKIITKLIEQKEGGIAK